MSDSGSASAHPILVTGALGNIGRLVVAGLERRGLGVRAADVNPQALAEAFGSRVDSVRFDFTDPASWPAAFTGVAVMFLMRPPQLSNRWRRSRPSISSLTR